MEEGNGNTVVIDEKSKSKDGHDVLNDDQC